MLVVPPKTFFHFPPYRGGQKFSKKWQKNHPKNHPFLIKKLWVSRHPDLVDPPQARHKGFLCSIDIFGIFENRSKKFLGRYVAKQVFNLILGFPEICKFREFRKIPKFLFFWQKLTTRAGNPDFCRKFSTCGDQNFLHFFANFWKL